MLSFKQGDFLKSDVEVAIVTVDGSSMKTTGHNAGRLEGVVDEEAWEDAICAFDYPIRPGSAQAVPLDDDNVSFNHMVFAASFDHVSPAKSQLPFFVNSLKASLRCARQAGACQAVMQMSTCGYRMSMDESVGALMAAAENVPEVDLVVMVIDEDKLEYALELSKLPYVTLPS